MSEIRLPYDDSLNIGVLSKVFERKRIANCYKYFWFQAILEMISEDKVRFSYDEILNQMIEDAWYMVTEYKLRLGPCNTTNHLEEAVKYIFSTTKISSTAKKGTVTRYLKTCDDPIIKRHKRNLIVNVPYCLQSPFYTSIKDLGRSKVDEINTQKHLLYYFVSVKGTNSQLEMNEEWVSYLIHNRQILLDWIKYNLIGYLQDRNPNVPGIVEKIIKPEKRDLRRVRDYWKAIIEMEPGITEIYEKTVMKDEKMSIDHFVPWQYVAHDELWNLSPTTKSINSQKGNQLPNFKDYFGKLSSLEYQAYKASYKYENVKEKYKVCLDYHVNNLDVRSSLYEADLDQPTFETRLLNIIKPVYDSAKLSGFTEWVR